jgi:AmmeMemoRadiSam system protein B
MGYVRSPAVAGTFYPGAPAGLERVVRKLTRSGGEREKALAVVAPHAGYIYSGAVAGEVFSSVEVPGQVVVLCPNHTGRGHRASILVEGSFSMPFGEVPVDAELARSLSAEAPLLREDRSAHAGEHSLEVMLPFLHRFSPAFRLVPVVLGGLSLDECRALGNALARVIRGERAKGEILVVASSDMTHYEPDGAARAKDALAIERILALDPEGLFRVVRGEGITMCGVLPVTVALFASVELGATRARLVRYATSGDTNGDRSRVVGYAGLVIS